MKVLFFDFITSAGGVPTVLGNLLPRLAPDMDVRFLDPLESFLGQRLAQSGVRVEERPIGSGEQVLGWTGKLHRFYVLVSKGPRYLSYSIWLGRYLRKQKIELVYCNFLKSAIVALPACWMAGARLVYHNHGVADPAELRSLPFRLLHWNAKAIIAVSEDVKSRLVVAGVPATRIKVIYNGIDPDNRPIREAAQKQDKVVLGFVGNLHPGKGVDILVDALGVLVDHGLPVDLWIIGDTPVGMGPDYPNQLKANVARQALQQHVRFWGHREDAQDLIEDIDILVLPSKYESFGMVLLEAMQRGKPCVASSVGGLPEVIEHEKTGLLYPSGDLPKLVAVLERLVQDSNLRLELGHEGRRRLERFFTLDAQAKSVAGLLREVVN